MLPSVGPALTGLTVPAGLPFNHPVAGHPHLDVPVLLLAVLAFAGVLVTGLAVPPGTPSTKDLPAASWEDGLSSPQHAVRALVVLLLVVAVVAGRTGTTNELDNLAPALVLGAGWPLLFLGALLTGVLWRWVDPWDAAARVLAPGDRSRPRDDVRLAVLVAIPLLWYVAAHSRPLHPRDLGLALACYTTVALAGSLALGRRRWLSSAEPLGTVLTWVGRARPSWGRDRTVPAGLGALLGVFAGATLFGAFRGTETWGELVDPTDPVSATVGLLAACLGGAALVVGFARVAELAAPRGRLAPGPVVVLSFAPAVVGMVVAVALERNRLFTSLQLLPGLLGDPFGRDWDLLGAASAGLDPAPLGAAGLLSAQLVVLVAGHLWGAVLAGRLLPRGARVAALLLLAQSAAGSLAVVTAH